MAGNYRIAEPPIDPTPDGMATALKSLTRQLNDLFAQMETDLQDRTGLEGPVTLTNDLNAQGKRLMNVAPSTTGTDAINRDEAQGLLRTERTARRRQRPIVRATGDNSTGVGGVAFAPTGDSATNNNFATCAMKLNQIINILNSL